MFSEDRTTNAVYKDKVTLIPKLDRDITVNTVTDQYTS